MRWRRWITISVLLALAMSCAPSSVQAQDTEELPAISDVSSQCPPPRVEPSSNLVVRTLAVEYSILSKDVCKLVNWSDRVTNLVVGLDQTENTDAVAAELIPRLQDKSQQITLKKWIELADYYKQVRTLFSGIFLFLGVIVFFMVLMASVNTLLMAMFERTREIGTMLAMGTPRRWIVALFMVEATLTGILGAIVGVVGGNLLGMALNASGLHHPPPPGTSFDMMFKVLHVPSLMVGSSILVVVSLALAPILPAIRASRLQIAEALAHV